MCLKHGQGTDIFAQGDVYSGQYQDGKPHGYGQYKWKNTSLYVGEFKNGMKHGKGKWRKRASAQNCNQYEGDYCLDKKGGIGVFTWESGNQYHGCYKDDERHGYGEMYWTDGSCYKGEWVNGIQHGLGTMTFPDGRVKEGVFENNVYKHPATNLNENAQLKAQQLLLRSQYKQQPPGAAAKLLPAHERAHSDEREFLNQTVDASDINSLNLRVQPSERFTSVQTQSLSTNGLVPKQKPDKFVSASIVKYRDSQSVNDDAISGSITSMSNSKGY